MSRKQSQQEKRQVRSPLRARYGDNKRTRFGGDPDPKLNSTINVDTHYINQVITKYKDPSPSPVRRGDQYVSLPNIRSSRAAAPSKNLKTDD